MRVKSLLVAVAMLPACSDGGDTETPDGGVTEPQCTESGQACIWFGVPGTDGFNGDGHHRLETKMYWSMDVHFGHDGTPYVIDWNNHLVRRVLPDQSVETLLGWIDPLFPGDGSPDEGDPGGALGTDVQMNHPTDLAMLPDGNLLVMAWHNHKLRKLDPTTKRVTIVGGDGAGYKGDGGHVSTALFRQPKSLELEDTGRMFILDQANLRVRMIDASGVVTTIAGDGMKGFQGDGGPATEARFGFETGSNPEPSGGLELSNNILYLSDSLNNRVRAIDLETNVITTIAGTGEKGYAGDGGPAVSAMLSNPLDLEIGPDGRLYVADTNNHVIRAIDLVSGTIETIAGTGTPGLDGGDGRPALETTLRRPFGIEFDHDGNLYISDTINSRILRVVR